MRKGFLFVIGLFFIPAFVFAGNLFINDNNTGNVGIGTDSVGFARFNVNITQGEMEGVYITRESGITTPYSYFNVENESGSTVFKINENGNVGIGVTNPTTSLQVNGQIYGTSITSSGQVYSPIFGTHGWRNVNTEIRTQNGYNIIFSKGAAGSDELMRIIGSTGNVGIGTSNPTKKLDIVGNGINLENTTFANQSGIIYKNGVPFIHNFNYGNNGTVTTVGKNIFIGENAGNFTMGSTAIYNIYASNNIGVGEEVFKNNTTGYANLAVGNFSLNSNTTGRENVSLGNSSLRSNTVGGQNTAVGFTSLNKNIDGGANAALGWGTLYKNTSGGSNSVLGYASLFNNTTGSNNSALGVQSLYYNVSGGSNSAVGYRSLFSNISGTYNSALGTYSLNNNTTGYYNLAVGASALYSNITGYYNSAVGAYSLNSNTTGLFNSAVGVSSLTSNTTGSYNIAIGNDSGRYIANGTSPNQTSTNSVYLGSSTKALASGDTNEIVIGYNAIGVGSNSVVLGNNDIIKTVLKGNVGIGVTSPQAKLTIPKNEWIASSNTDGTSTVNMFRVNSNGEIQVGAPLIAGTLTASEDTGATTLFNMPVSSSSAQGTEMSASIAIDYTPILKVYSESDGMGGIQNEAVNITGDTYISGDLTVDGIVQAGRYASNPVGTANTCYEKYMGGVIYNSTNDVMCYCMESVGVYTWKRFDGATDCY